jgi:hypothetical protein
MQGRPPNQAGDRPAVADIPVFLSVVCFIYALPDGCADGRDKTAIRVESSLVLVDVIAQNGKTALPLTSLNKEDFRVFDNGKEKPIESFDTGAHYGAHPIVLWVAVICNEKNWDEKGSGFMRRDAPFIRPALDHLDKTDTMGVAHWCDDGTASIDVPPGRDFDGALANLERLFQLPPKETSNGPGIAALQKMLRLILENTRKMNPQPLPVIVFFYGDHGGMSADDADPLLNDLLETSVIVFGINDGGWSVNPNYLAYRQWRSYIAHYFAAMTGGQFFSVEPKQFAAALDDILAQVHFRYVLGFRPDAIDGKDHTLDVQLTKPATKKYPSIRLAFRPTYIASKSMTKTK